MWKCVLELAHQTGPKSFGTKFRVFCGSYLWVFTAIELNIYITILTPSEHKKQSYSRGAKGFFFNFIATVHNYLWLCTVAKS